MPPPGVVPLVLGFGAGLATGLSRFHAPAIAFVGLAAAVVLRQRDGVLLPLALVLGVGHGMLAVGRAGGHCAAVLQPGRRTIEVRLEERAREGLVQASLRRPSCHGTVALRWPADQDQPGGTVARVTGEWRSSGTRRGLPHGVFQVRRIDVRAHAPDGAVRLRDWVQATSEHLYGPRAAVVDALVLGRRAEMDPALREAFARSGLVHLLSISGFHVGLIVTWVGLVLRLLRVPRPWALLGAAAFGTAYVGFLGWPAPAMRAALLAGVSAMSMVRQRRVQATPLLAVTALGVLLLDPWALYDMGGWLSVTALWGATTFARWGRRAVGRGRLWQTFCSSVGATLGTAPVTAAVLGTVAVAGIVLNFAAIPLAALAVPAVTISLVLAAVAMPLAEALAAGAGLTLVALERVALWGAAVPGAAVSMPTGWTGGLVGGAALALGRWVTADRVSWPLAARRAAWIIATCWVPVTAWEMHLRQDGKGALSLFFLPVGQGDGAAIRTPGGQWVLVDAGPADARHDAGKAVVVPFLQRRAVGRIHSLVVSHAHADHLGGVGAVLEALQVERVMEPGRAVPDSLYQAFLAGVADEGAIWSVGRPPAEWVLDGVRFRVLHPDTTWLEWGEDLNEDSLVLLVEYGGFRALFTGDAGLPVERRLQARVGAVDVLKLGHHGSRTASGLAWLTALRPRAAVISVGRNRYGHPHPEVLARLDSLVVPRWHTDSAGLVQVRTDGCRVTVRGGGRSLDYTREEERCHSARPSPPSKASSSSRSGSFPRPPGN